VWKVLTVLTLAFGLSCGGGDSDDTSADTELSGRVYYAGPVENATVIAYQLVEGERTGEIGRATTDATGRFAINVGLAYETLELEARGGTYAEPLGGTLDLDDDQVLRGVALEVAPGEKRGDVAVTPWSHLVVTLGEARLATGAKEPSYNAALDAARDHLAAHLGFDPTRAAIAALDAAATSPTQPVQHALSLAGLATLADGVRLDAALSAQDLNTTTLLRVLTTDAGSAEALFDGNGDALALGPACDRTFDCEAGADACRTGCAIYWNTLRSRLGVAIAAFLQTEANASPLEREDVQSWLEALAANADPELFDGPIEPLDELGPTIVWGAPAADAEVAGAVAIEVTAHDPLGVASLTVSIVGAATISLDDDSPDAESFTTTLATSTLPEGPLTFEATAVDEDGNDTTVTRTVTLNNVDGGTVSGVVFKGRVDGATVRVYEFDGTRGAQLGEGTTAGDGTFTNVAIADGYAGPLLIEAGFGGSYTEEAAPSGAADVTLDLDDRLRTVVVDYADGDAIANVVASPLTSFAVTYLGWLRGQAPTGDLAAQWQTAHEVMEAQFGVPDILRVAPLAPVEMQSATLTAAAKYGLVAIGLSETAFQASTQGGGTGGAFGTTMNGARVVEVLEADLADGCWDGRAGTTPLFWGGVESVTSEATRLELGNAIVAYLRDAARNVTAFTGAVDVLSLLDTLAGGGPASGEGSCATGALYPDEGGVFDQTVPAVSFVGGTPAAGAHVRGTITVAIVASDDIDTMPRIAFASPADLAGQDNDGDANDADATITVNTLGRTDGALTVVAHAYDDSNVEPGVGTRTFTIDNTAPVITVGAPAQGAWVNTAQTLTFSISEANLAASMATLDGVAILSPHTVSAPGTHTFVVTASDQAGNSASVTRTFSIDPTPPTVGFVTPTPAAGAYVRGTVSVRATASDDLDGSPMVVWTAPAGLVDTNVADATADASVVTGADGPLVVTARATDEAGNQATASRTFNVDNTAPVLTLSNAGVYVDGTTWWTTTQAPTVSGTVVEAHAPVVTARVGAALVGTATVTGTSWSMTLNAGSIAAGGTDVTFTATDAAGNTATLAQRFAADTSAPLVSVGTTTVADERNDTITFPGHVANHAHTSTGQVSLGGAGCPHVYKHVYFLDEGPAAYVVEGGKNPLRFQFDVTDVGGVGLDTSASGYRVKLQGSASYLTSWRTVTGVGIAGGERYIVDLFRKNSDGDTLLAELGTTEGAFEVELRGLDRLGREVVQTRCWTNHPLAPALEYTAAAAAGDHAPQLYALAGLSLAQTGDPIAAQLMNATAPGVGLMQFEVWHSGAEPAYLTLDLEQPTGVTLTMHGQISYAHESTSGASFNCGTIDEPSGANECQQVSTLPVLQDIPRASVSLDGGNSRYTVRVFDASWQELATCAGCESTDARREFLLPASTGVARRFYVVAVLAGLSEQLDIGGTSYSESTLTYNGGASTLQISGALGSTTRRCGSALSQSGQTLICPAGQVRTYRQYRMLRNASIDFPTGGANGDLVVRPAATATATLVPPSTPTGNEKKLLPVPYWSTIESATPTQIPSP
jgi:hypothetical protein